MVNRDFYFYNVKFGGLSIYIYIMNVVWTSILIIGLIVLMVIDPENAFSVMLDGSNKAIELSLSLWAVYALWLGVLQIIEDTGLDKVFCKVLKPVIGILFKDIDEYTKEQLAVNLASNILGMGNACTPSGINAIAGMYNKEKKLTGNMGLLVIFNTANIQLIPTTIIGIRILHGSAIPSKIIVPTIITSLLSLIVGIVLSKVCARVFLKEERGK